LWNLPTYKRTAPEAGSSFCWQGDAWHSPPPFLDASLPNAIDLLFDKWTFVYFLNLFESICYLVTINGYNGLVQGTILQEILQVKHGHIHKDPWFPGSPVCPTQVSNASKFTCPPELR
jgi:hypothetical protein